MDSITGIYMTTTKVKVILRKWESNYLQLKVMTTVREIERDQSKMCFKRKWYNFKVLNFDGN